ncbi:hypothetical protein TSAR_007596 [Trichomalopsis sarcophagae]|uniref:Uncharacterized protein n=1 Tax=Trichomalopsis sarcophagae TaxID=543379 RepID=A0A232EQM2_9HYME|nr:hypothetical protein TSAR_007596 [Trichomalopsis sarcophagae]
MDLKSYFTTSEEIGEWEDHDPTTNIVGYIDSITAPSPSGLKQELFFKFTVSNGSNKVYVLVININAAYCRVTDRRVTKKTEEKNLVPFDLIIKENTTVTFMGYYLLTNAALDELHRVTFDDIHTVQGLIEISGYIRTKFSLIHNRSGVMNYGIGAITNGTKKLLFKSNNSESLSSKLEIIFSCYHFCNDMDDIQFDSDNEAMLPELVQRGCRPVKRIRTKE